MGAWIETPGFAISYQTGKVAPYVGAWIETEYLDTHVYKDMVAPYVGAWIETSSGRPNNLRAESRTLCGCVD